MLLAIDIGNSHMVAGIYNNHQLQQHWRLRTDRSMTADELAATMQGLFSLEGYRFDDITNAVIASVVPSLKLTLNEFFTEYMHLSPCYVSAAQTGTMRIQTDFPAEVGADRIVNGLAARAQYGFPAIIVDFGTAITFDCLNDNGDYIGGSIVPGMAIAIDALSSRTAKLPRIDITIPPKSPIGTNTEEAIRAGMLFGYGGLVEEIIAQISKTMAPAIPAIIATGGMAHLIAPYAPSLETIDQLLTLEGLFLYHDLCA